METVLPATDLRGSRSLEGIPSPRPPWARPSGRPHQGVAARSGGNAHAGAPTPMAPPCLPPHPPRSQECPRGQLGRMKEVRPGLQALHPPKVDAATWQPHPARPGGRWKGEILPLGLTPAAQPISPRVPQGQLRACAHSKREECLQVWPNGHSLGKTGLEGPGGWAPQNEPRVGGYLVPPAEDAVPC